MNAPENRNLTTERGNGLMPTKDFFTAEYHQLEKERVFKKSWLRVGNEELIPNVGDYFVKEIESCDTSVIVVRGRDQRIRAFHNNCSHRNNRIAYLSEGNTNGFKCRFHSWSYGLDGKLMAIPDEHLFPGLSKADNGLAEVACDSWEGFVFVNVDPKPAKTLREYLGEEIYTGYSGFFTQFTRVGKLTSVVNANWKVFLDAFVESYHFSTVHAASASNVVTSREFPNGNIDAFREFGPHRTISVTSSVELHTPALSEKLVGKFSGGQTLAGDRTKTVVTPPQINPKKKPDWLSDILIVFPMANFQALQGFFVSQNYWPLSHDRTRWEFEIYMRAPRNAAEEIAIEYNRNYLRDVVREDLQNLNWVQSNLNARTKSHQILGEMETMVRSAYKTLAEQVGSGW